MFGQAASSQTVWRPFSFTIARVALYWPDPGALTRSQSGFFSTAVSGRFCFSGWRSSAGDFVRVSISVTKAARAPGVAKPLCRPSVRRWQGGRQVHAG